MEEVIRLFPKPYQILLKNVNWSRVQEIRVRVNRKLEVLDSRSFRMLDEAVIKKEDVAYILNQVSQFSLYRFKDELTEGYITIHGGHRVGLAGRTNTIENRVDTMKDITFMNIRIARSAQGCADRYLPYLQENGKWKSILIVGPLHSGKTTLLRELARKAGSGGNSRKVAVIDERSEIAASLKGVPQLEIGERTDLMDGCPKAEGMMMMIRSMSPDLLIVDEIGSKQDAEAMLEAALTGVEVVCSIHGSELTTVRKRPVVRELLNETVFSRYILLERISPAKSGTVSILDSTGQKLVQFREGQGYGMDRSFDRIDRYHLDRV